MSRTKTALICIAAPVVVTIGAVSIWTLGIGIGCAWAIAREYHQIHIK